MSKTFLFLYEHLKMGGIETSLIKMIRAYRKQNIRIIWIRYGNPNDIYEPWKKELEDNEVEVIQADIIKDFFFCSKKPKFQDDEEVYAVAFDPMDFVRLQILRENYKIKFNCFYIVPHFEGSLNYLEESYFIKKNKIRKALSAIYQCWYNNGNLLFFSPRHEVEMEKRYGVNCIGNNDKLLRVPEQISAFDMQKAKKRAMRQNFKIITCGRFDFPHKGYVFGLVDIFSRIIKDYPNLSLDIVGYGVNEARIRDYVEQLENSVKKHITFWGAVAPDDMSSLYDQSHVNISVAGAILDSARTGLVSLPARHYTYSCEVYGWFTPNNDEILHNEPGEDAENYIRKLIEMSDEEYINLCLSSYNAAKKDTDPLWLFKQNICELASDNCEKEIVKIYRHRMRNRRLRDFFRSFLVATNLLDFYKTIRNKIKNFFVRI